MSFQPVVAGAGLVGWAFLQNTQARQTEVFNRSPALIRDTDHFAENIATVRTAEDLVSDRRMLRVALGAFGLQDDIDSRAFIRTILEQGTRDEGALANRLTDDRYQKLASAFGFDAPGGPRSAEPGFAKEIVELYRQRRFEQAVGEQAPALRLGLNATRELPQIARSNQSENGKWFTIMGTPPLREVFETVLGLPAGFGQVEIDQQLEIFKDRAEAQLGLSSLADLADPARLDTLVERFLLMDQIATDTSMSSGSIALTLLQAAPSPGARGF